jgi:hypothetical protein
VSRFSAIAAVGLADLSEMAVGDGVKLSMRARAEVELPAETSQAVSTFTALTTDSH